MKRTPNFFVSPNDRVELALLRLIGQIARILLERLERRFGVFARHALITTHIGKRMQQILKSNPQRRQNISRLTLLARHRQNKVFRRHVIVAHLLRQILRNGQNGIELARNRRIRPRHHRQTPKRTLQTRRYLVGLHANPLKQRAHNPTLRNQSRQ